MSASVQLRGVSKRYGHVVAVDNVSLSIHAGEFLTLLGPSGCGKTTLLRLVAGFVAPDSGAVLIGEQDVTAVPPHLRNVNQVFQSYALFPHLSARDNIAFGLRMQRRSGAEIHRRVREVVSLVALEGCEDRKPNQLSGGQQQRVALARALAPEPAVLLLDEPLSALDARLRQAMQVELKRLQRQIGTTFIFVTHDQEEALTMSDRIALVRAGKIEQCGGVQEIYHRPATTFAAEFVGQTNLLTATFLSREGDTVRCRIEGGLEFSVSAGRWPKEKNSVTLSIRPEMIHVGRTPGAETNTFPAVVQEILFQGAVNRFKLLTDGGNRLSALIASSSTKGEALGLGQRIQCVVHAEDIAVVLPSL